MALFDMPLDDLRSYLPERHEPDDFDAFWKRTLEEAAQLAQDGPATAYRPYDGGLSTVEVYDVTFSGWGGHPVAAWLIVPKGVPGPVPCVVQYIGYGGGRGLPHDHLVWPAGGRAAFIMDTRGQGAAGRNSAGATPDPVGGGNPQAPGFMTRGILDPATYYYRRVFTDAVRAVDAAAAHPAVDAARICVAGGSQGGGIATAVAGLRPDIAAALVDVPFLQHFRRALTLTDQDPYQEIVRFLATQRGTQEQVLRTLSYMDGLNFAARATAPALYSAALMDTTCAPSTVFAAYNHWAGEEKEITVYPWNGHEGGSTERRPEQLRWLRDRVA
ncbi:acetylxylan esterase [Actinacidiphila alni]|uniref:acetylxylan esterase n=1 Tax=Actinacidiphila alni TaxID=380248 RepID=UPI00345471A1